MRNARTSRTTDPVRMRAGAMLSLLVLSLLLLSACTTRPPRPYQIEHTLRQIGCEGGACSGKESEVEVTYLGASGLLIQYRGAALLTAPFFSNPALRRIALTTFLATPSGGNGIAPDHGLIERFLPRAADGALSILVGHGHYDHLMDVPYIAAHRAKSATIYGSPSVRHMLMGDSGLRAHGGTRVVAIHPRHSGTADRVGKWTYSTDGSFRFMALAANHAPAIKRFGRSFHFASGTLSRDLKRLPVSAFDWKLGEPYAYLIDVLAPGDTTPRFRIFYQDAPSSPPLGFPPRSELNARRVDLAVICAATSMHFDGTPDRLLKFLAPRYVMITHWESFFRRGTLGVHAGPASELDRFISLVRGSLPAGTTWRMPVPQTVLHFEALRN